MVEHFVAVCFFTWLWMCIICYISSCSTIKKINKSSSKSDSSSVKHSSIDSSATDVEFTVVESEDSTVTVTENILYPVQIDSGVGIIVTNGNADDYTEILPASFPRTIYLPKTKKSENKKSTTKEEKAQAKTVETKKETTEAVDVSSEESKTEKDVERRWFQLPWWLWPLAAVVLYFTTAFRLRWFPFIPSKKTTKNT